MRLRWVGDGTGRLTARDLLVFVVAATADDTTALWRSLNPDGIPLATQLAIDEVNLGWLRTIQVARLGGAKGVQFQPLYATGVWAHMGPQKHNVLEGEYVQMTFDECREWLEEMKQRQTAAA